MNGPADVLAALIAQGGPSATVKASGEVSCRYRFEDRKCAAGQLLPDSLYTPPMEDSTWATIVTPEIEATLPAWADKRTVALMQLAHDRAATEALAYDQPWAQAVTREFQIEGLIS